MDAWELMADVATADPKPFHFALAREYAGDDEGATDDLARRLVNELRRFRAALGMDGEPPEWGGTPPERDGMLELDANAANALEALGGPWGRKQAEAVRRAAAERWRTYTDAPGSTATVPGVAPPAPAGLWRLWLPDAGTHGASCFARALAGVLWFDVVRPEIERRRRKPPAVVQLVLGELAPAMARTSHLERTDDGKDRILALDGREVAVLNMPPGLPPAVARILVTDAHALLTSVHAHRLLHYAVTEGHRRVLAGEPDPGRLGVPGGWQAWAAKLGQIGNKAAEHLRNVAYAMGSLYLPRLPSGYAGQLWAAWDRRAAPGRKAEAGLSLTPILLPGAVFKLNPRPRLVPALPPPPGVGRPNEHGPQALLQLLFLLHYVERGPEVAESGGVQVPPALWCEWARIAGVPEGTVPAVLDAWCNGPEAVLQRVEPDRYNLADRFKAARDFLTRGTQRSLRQQRRGRAGAARREREDRNPRRKH